MFQSARIKLTVWYSLIIFIISVSFSVAIYEVLTSELDRVESMQRQQIERRFTDPFFLPPSQNFLPRHFYLNHELIAETKHRLSLILGLINVGILGLSTAGGYLLAGKTLKPIANMVDKQNRFITDASHELRTPITSLKTEIEVNLRDKKLTLEQAKNTLKSNMEEVNNLQYLTNNLIKLTQYKKSFDFKTFENLDMSGIIKESVKKVANMAKYKNIHIINSVKNCVIKGDKDSLVELFVIFLDNAIKYSPKKTQITLFSKKTGDQITIEITDQGVGIDQKDLPNIFDRFYRSSKSRTKNNIIGYGLGLAIAKQIIDKYHGTIEVNSKLNKGTIFTIKLPASQTI